MSYLFIAALIGIGLLGPTAYAAKIGAPWAPTASSAIRRTFEEFGIGEGDVLVDLGAGDGKILAEAARRGARAIGYELSPIMFAAAWIRINVIPLIRGTKGVGEKRTKLRCREFFRAELPKETTAVFAFLMPHHMPRLHQYVARQHLANARFLFVYAFPIKELDPLHIVRVDNCAPVYVYDMRNL